MKKDVFYIIFLVLNIAQVGWGQVITYHQNIAPILEKNCVACHQKNEIGAMPLTNYEEVAAYGKMIAYVTKTKLMPPFLADKPINQFKGEKRLSATEIKLLEQWVQQGLLEGESPEKLLKPSTTTTHLSNPDAIFSMSEAFQQYGIYYDQYRVFVLPTNLTEDKWVSAIEFVPGNKKIVRHAMISLDTSNRVQTQDDWDPQYGYFSYGELGFVPMENRWFTWNPTQSFSPFSIGVAKFLPKNSKLLLHIHYGPTGVPLKDSSSIRLKFVDKPVRRLLQTAALINPTNLTNDTFYIAANEKVRFHAKFTVPYDIELFGLYPHAHYLGRKWEIFALEPESRNAETLLKINDWDFHWKQFFEYQQPKIIKKGTVIHALAEYDNTLDNLANPSDPPREMAWGKRMYEEMFLVFFSFAPYLGEDKGEPFFEIRPIATNISRSQFELSFFTKKEAAFSFEIKNFSGEVVSQLFENQFFKKGNHVLEIAVKDLKKGNYYLCLKSGEMEVKQIFLNVEQHIFD